MSEADHHWLHRGYVVTCRERAGLLALLYFLLCFCHFPMWYPWSGVVLDCFDSLSLHSILVLRIWLFWGVSSKQILHYIAGMIHATSCPKLAPI